MKSERKWVFVLVSLLTALALNISVASAATVASDKATFIHTGEYRAYNFGGTPDMETSQNAGGMRYLLVGWDLGSVSLGPGETIANAKIVLTHYWGTMTTMSKGDYTNTISVITEDWIEGTRNEWWPYPGGPATDGSVTADNRPAMTVLGGAAIDTWTEDENYAYHNITNGSELDELVEGWISGSVFNYGVQLMHQEWSSYGWTEGFFSDNAGEIGPGGYVEGDASLRPMLVFDVVPEPATMLLLTLGSALALRRRKSV